jgi:hypothetical protein
MTQFGVARALALEFPQDFRIEYVVLQLQLQDLDDDSLTMAVLLCTYDSTLIEALLTSGCFRFRRGVISSSCLVADGVSIPGIPDRKPIRNEQCFQMNPNQPSTPVGSKLASLASGMFPLDFQR